MPHHDWSFFMQRIPHRLRGAALALAGGVRTFIPLSVR